MQAHKLKVTVPEDHRLSLALPQDFPTGPAEVIVLAVPQRRRKVVRAAGALSPEGPLPEGDPIGEALQELREERAERLERVVGKIERAPGS